MNRTEAILELNMLLAHANRLDLPEAQDYQRAIEDLLERKQPMIKTGNASDFTRFHTVNVHLDDQHNEWFADWHSYQMLVDVTGAHHFSNTPESIAEVSGKLEAVGQSLACYECPCSACQPASLSPVQRFIERAYALRNSAANKLETDTYQAMIDTAEKHQATYGEEGIVEIIYYFDSLAGQVNLYASGLIRQQADDLQRRLENRMAREADERAAREAEQQALAAQQ